MASAIISISMLETNLKPLVDYMKTETEQDKIKKQKEEQKRRQQLQQSASDNTITNPTILKKYGLTESTNPQMLME